MRYNQAWVREAKIKGQVSAVLEAIVLEVVENNQDPCVMATPVIENPNHTDLIEPEKPKKKKIIKKKKKKMTPEQIAENEKKINEIRRQAQENMAKKLKAGDPEALEQYRSMTSMVPQGHKTRRPTLEDIPSDELKWENMTLEEKFMESIFESTKPQLFSLRGGLEKLGQGYHKISHMNRDEHTQALLKCKKWRGDNHWKKIIPLVKKSTMGVMEKNDWTCYRIFQDLKENNYIWDDSFYDGGWIFE
jgi:hypothetical protein